MKDDPYKIATAEELWDFADKVNNQGQTSAWAELTDDIDLSEICSEEDGVSWTPIGNSSNNQYTGTFNGQNFKISGLYIDSNADGQGLFGYVSGSGTVQNLSVSGSVSVSGNRYVGGVVGLNLGTVTNCAFSGSVSGSDHVGGVVGNNGDIGSVKNCYNIGKVTGSAASSNVGGVVGYNDGNVKNCYNTGSVTSSGNPLVGDVGMVGGVVGWNSSSGTVTNCYNTGAVSGGVDVGGVVGYNGGNVENCYNTGKVTGTRIDDYVGGVVGYNGGNVENCYNTGKVTGSSDYSYIGGVVGYNSSFGNVTGCYFLSSTAASGIGSGGADATPLTAEEFADQRKFPSWTDFTDTWEIESIFGRPTLQANAEIGGTANNPYRIFTATQLENFRDIVNGANNQTADPDAHAKLMNDIDLKDVCGPELDAETSWEPIGNSEENAYTGTFDGNGNTIENLYINNTTNDYYQGLFGYVGTRGTVQNLSVSGSVSGSNSVGGVVGRNDGTVENCYNTGTVTGTDDHVGGVVGQNRGSVTNCYNTGTGTVTGTDDYVGGVVGLNSAIVENCYNTVSVSGNNYVGGVVGWNISSGNVKNCYNTGTGTVTGTVDFVGGVVGQNFGGTVENCYNTVNVTGTGNWVGGVVGFNSSGYDDIPDVIVANCYFLQTAEVNDKLQGIGGGSGTSSNVEPRTADAFHSGEVAWRLENGQTAGSSQVWGQNLMNEPKDNYPQLRAFDADTPQVYKVAFMNGEEYHAEYANNGMTVGSPTTNPTKEGYTFAGWFTESSGGSQWNFSTAVTENMTLYAHWTAVEEPEPEPEEPPYSGKYSYEVSTSVGDNGTVTVDRYATEGEKVTIDVTPDQAYKLDELVVTANGKDVELTANSDGTYSFTMPSADVKITATFAEDPDWTEPEEPTTDVSDLFIDVTPDAWYKDAVQYAYDNGLMTGVSDTEFAPEATTTRAMIVSILARLEGVTTAQAAGFADVTDEWYATAVNWAASVGVVNGYEDNTFKPNTAITREQLAAILMNYAAYKGYDVSARADLSHYSDADSISSWANDVLLWAVAEGLLTGVTDDTIAPQAHATRAQVAAILQRFLSE